MFSNILDSTKNIELICSNENIYPIIKKVHIVDINLIFIWIIFVKKDDNNINLDIINGINIKTNIAVIGETHQLSEKQLTVLGAILFIIHQALSLFKFQK